MLKYAGTERVETLFEIDIYNLLEIYAYIFQNKHLKVILSLKFEGVNALLNFVEIYVCIYVFVFTK